MICWKLADQERDEQRARELRPVFGRSRSELWQSLLVAWQRRSIEPPSIVGGCATCASRAAGRILPRDAADGGDPP